MNKWIFIEFCRILRKNKKRRIQWNKKLNELQQKQLHQPQTPLEENLPAEQPTSAQLAKVQQKATRQTRLKTVAGNALGQKNQQQKTAVQKLQK